MKKYLMLLSDSSVTCCQNLQGTGPKNSYPISEATKVYDITDKDLLCGVPGALERGCRIWAVLDDNGTVSHAYIKGACGNVNEKSRIGAERKFQSCRSHGLALAAYTESCLDFRMKPVEPGPIEALQQRFYGPINHTMDHLADKAWEIRSFWNETFDTEKAMEMAKPLGIRSVYHANAIKTNSERTEKEDGLMIFNAVQLGKDLAFTTFPGELFDAIGQRIEDDSPYKNTMLFGYSHHHVGYLPTMVAYKYTSYETDITRFAPGTGEQVADTHVDMLRQLKNEKSI